MTPIFLAAATFYCSVQTADAWSQTRNVSALPVNPCIMQMDNGAYRCGRKLGGCLSCGPYPCPKIGIKGAGQ